MTAEQRELVRRLRDAAVRAKVEPLSKALAGVIYCSRCGIELDEWTPGCSTCWNRFYQKMKCGKVDPIRFERLRRCSIDYTYMKNRSTINGAQNPGGIAQRGKAPVSTWADHRANFGLDGRVTW